jgi:hypothetical protein
MNTFSKSILKFAFLGLIIFAFSCSKSDSNDTNETEDCDNFGPTSGSVVINGVTYNAINQYILTEDLGAYTHVFQLAGVSSDCNELRALSFALINTSSSPAGTYPIKSFLGSTINTANGNYVVQKLSSASQTAIYMESGELIIKVVGTKKFEINLNSVLTDQSNVSAKATHQF